MSPAERIGPKSRLVGVQRHLDVSRTRYLPAVAGEGFVLGLDEPIGPGLQRISLAQFDRAISHLSDPAGDRDSAVHETRKTLKRLRAILRMVRPELGERVYRYENRVLRDAARSISPVRDSWVMVETVGALADRFEGAIPIDVFDDLSERLDRRALAIRRRILEEGGALPGVLETLRRSRTRFAGWPVEEGARAVYGSAIGEGFDAIGPGVGQTFARGRQEMSTALRSRTAPAFHRWRKRVKYLRHQMEILHPLWPEVVGGTALSLDRLGDILGEEHDLAELLSLLSVAPDLCPDPVERSLLAALAQHRRGELQLAARVLGARVYAEKPKAFVSRLAAYWDSTRIPVGVGQLPLG
jgi:CHAD domain-containing protein